MRLQDVVLRGLGTPGPAGMPAVRVGGGSRVRLTSVTLDAGGRGLQLDQPAVLAVDGLIADHATGDVLGLVGGSGATISHLRTTGTAGAALRLRATTATTLSGFVSAGDTRALVATDVAGLHADGVRTAGSGLLVGGPAVDLRRPSSRRRWWRCRSTAAVASPSAAGACAGRRPSGPTGSPWACGSRE